MHTHTCTRTHTHTHTHMHTHAHTHMQRGSTRLMHPQLLPSVGTYSRLVPRLDQSSRTVTFSISLPCQRTAREVLCATHTMYIGNIPEDPELGTPCYTGQNCWFESCQGSKCQLSVLLPEGKRATKRQLYSGPFTLREAASFSTNRKDLM